MISEMSSATLVYWSSSHIQQASAQQIAHQLLRQAAFAREQSPSECVSFATGRGTTHEPDRAEPAADQVHADWINAWRSPPSSNSMICGGDPCRTGAVLGLQPSLCVPARPAVPLIGDRAPPASERLPAGPPACRRAEEVCPFRLRRRHRGRAVRRGCRGPLAALCASKRCSGGDGAPRQVLAPPCRAQGCCMGPQ